MAKVKIGTEVQIMRPFKIFRQLNDGSYDACDAHGNCLKVNPNEINILTKNQSEMKAMKDAVLATAKQLCKANNTVTTLEIKTELRRDYPYYFWDQATVSNYMAQLAGDGIFNYTDNGTYRTYSLAKTPATKTISSAKTLNIVVTKTLYRDWETLRGRRRKTTHERVGSHEESTEEFGPNCEENTTETRELDEGPTSGSDRPCSKVS